MENATKVLLMAGGMLIGLMIVSCLVLMFNSLTSYQQINKDVVQDTQVVEFNNQYATYDRDDVRGSDLVSLINKVVDYNIRKSEENFEEMKIDVVGIKPENFQFDENKNFLIKTSYNQNNLKSDLLDTVKGLEAIYGEKCITNLSSNIENIVIDSKDQSEINDSIKKLQQMLPKSIDSYGGLEKIKNDIQTYYEYSKLKKSYFNCVDRRYNTQTGRVVYMKFEYQRTGV